MERVFIHVHKSLLEHEPPVLRLIRETFGEYIIEGEIPGSNSTIAISFYTDKVSFKEGENRQVDLTLKRNEDNTITFDKIEKIWA